jgi:hypothetical protein
MTKYIGSFTAETYLGLMYENGPYVQRDINKTIEYYECLKAVRSREERLEKLKKLISIKTIAQEKNSENVIFRFR